MPVSTFKCTGCCATPSAAAAVSSVSMCHGSQTVGVRCRRIISASSPRQKPVIKRMLARMPGFAQRNRFVERSHAQPARAFGLERARALDRAVTVGVGLHHGAHRDLRSHVLLHGAEVLPQCCQRNFRPGRTRRHAAQDFCCGCHFRDYSGSSQRAQVTPGLLPRNVARRGGRIAARDSAARTCVEHVARRRTCTRPNPRLRSSSFLTKENSP